LYLPERIEMHAGLAAGNDPARQEIVHRVSHE
jgi:hypothetical protein